MLGVFKESGGLEPKRRKRGERAEEADCQGRVSKIIPARRIGRSERDKQADQKAADDVDGQRANGNVTAKPARTCEVYQVSANSTGTPSDGDGQ